MKKSLFVLGLLGASASALTATVAPAEAQDKTRWKMQSAFASSLTHLGPSGLRFAKNIDRMSGGKFEVKFYEPGALIPAARVLRCGLQGLDRVLLDDAGLSHRQVSVARLLHDRAVRAYARGVSGVEVARRRQQAAGRDLRQARSRRSRRQLHRPRDLRLVPQGGQIGRGDEGHQDALLRPRRPGDAEARRVDAATGRGRHLSGARARRDRCHRVLHARHGHQARLPSDRQVQLLPWLAPAGLMRGAADE